MLNINLNFKDPKSTQRAVYVLPIVILLIIILVLIYFLFFYTNACTSKECFYNSLKDCKRTSYVREDERASWFYRITGGSKEYNCKVEVRLLKMKQGTIDIEKLEGKKMSCLVPKDEIEYPERDMTKCAGLLKEELQEILIQRMHNYLLQNLGELKEEFI